MTAFTDACMAALGLLLVGDVDRAMAPLTTAFEPFARDPQLARENPEALALLSDLIGLALRTRHPPYDAKILRLFGEVAIARLEVVKA